MAKTVYKKKIKNGKEYYFYRLRHENLDKPKDIYARTVKELEAKIKSIVNELDHGVIYNNKTFGVFLENWLYDVKFMNIKNTTKAMYESPYRNHIKNSPLTKLKLTEITRDKVQTFYNNLQKKNVGIPTIRIIHLIIGAALRYAYNNDMIIKDFTKALILPKISEEDKLKKDKKIHAFTKEEQKIYIEGIKNSPYELIFLMALYTGLRQSELLALTWNDIDFKNNIVSVNKIAKYQKIINREGTGGTKIVVQTPKSTSSIRKVPIPQALVNKLKQHRAKLNESKLVFGKSFNDKNLIFYNPKSDYYSGKLIYYYFEKSIKDINKVLENKLPMLTFHDLRHTYATRLFELGENPKTVQELLGHSSISVTLNIYTHVMEEAKQNTVNKLDILYKSML
ncbi:site-specific integrase [uncultured Clostridium sp.]|uniref:tyrosine-type recombinase/integrase n=1 Tax=uncultured Clostridium sp. TaxID=59620 RepID=UPI0025FF9A75|nr:site-specific integrase [uncultured Clostridium sp.]